MLRQVPQGRLIRFREWREELGTSMYGVEEEGESESASVPGVVVFYYKGARGRFHYCSIVKKVIEYWCLSYSLGFWPDFERMSPLQLVTL